MFRSMAIAAAILVGMSGHADPAVADTPSDCEQNCFVLSSLSISGVRAYPISDLATHYVHQLANWVDQEDLVRTADAITQHYRQDGYFLTRAVVAPGDMAAGNAQIVVYEGHIEEVVIEGSGAQAVEGILRPLEQRSILTIGELDRRLALASDVPGVRLISRIEPMMDNPAGHRLIVTATLTRIEAGVFSENRGSEAQGPWQVYGWTAVNSVVREGDRLSVSALVTPQDRQELAYAEASYSTPLPGHARLKVSISGYSTNAPPGSWAWLSGDSLAASVSVSQPLVRRKDRSLHLTASLEVRDVEQTYVGGDIVDERLSVFRGMVAGQRTGAKGWVSGWVQGSRGVDLFGATAVARPGQTRGDATGQFTKVSAGASAYRDLGRYLGVYASGTAQWSDDPLLGSEEFYVGGSEIGRAFTYGERSGDKGVAGVVELRLGWDPSPGSVKFLQIYGFVDGGRVWNQSANGDVSADLASAGVGTRISFDGRATVRAELARPISGRALDNLDGGWRAFLSLSNAF